MHLPEVKEGGVEGKVEGGEAAKGAPREKPQKVLACPRCESMNTKFCYYNNYSVNQPRHFCRQCQRYWTVGGTLRNVPVGGGSRKKNRHPRAGEPYLRTTGTPLAMANPPLAAYPHGSDVPAFHFSPLPGFLPTFPAAPPHFPMDPPAHSSPGMFIHPLPSKPADLAPMFTPGNFYPDLSTLHPPVKAEVWASHPETSTQPWQSKPTSGGDDQAFEPPMLLHLGLNSRPHRPAPWTTTAAAAAANGTSPPHGSSTIEEEGSTPTNGYSNSGYEEGDTVSSMWQEMHDMHDIFQ